MHNNPKGKDMEFNQKEEVVIVDEKKTSVFEAKQVKVEEYPCKEADKLCNKRWLESLSDCA